MVRASIRVLMACMLAISIFLPAGVATAAGTSPVRTVAVAQQPTPRPGPDIPTAPTTQDGAQSRNKLVIAVVALLLLAIVILGHRARTKRRKKSEGG
jgi:hypothetical protein